MRATNGTVLIVDRATPTRRSLAQRLRAWSGRVLEADGPAEARDVARGTPIDVVLLDLASLGEEGILLIPFLREVRPAARVILLTRSEQVQLAIRGMRLGAWDDLPIPVDVETLVDRIAEALESEASGNEGGAGTESPVVR